MFLNLCKLLLVLSHRFTASKMFQDRTIIVVLWFMQFFPLQECFCWSFRVLPLAESVNWGGIFLTWRELSTRCFFLQRLTRAFAISAWDTLNATGHFVGARLVAIFWSMFSSGQHVVLQLSGMFQDVPGSVSVHHNQYQGYHFVVGWVKGRLLAVSNNLLMFLMLHPTKC